MIAWKTNLLIAVLASILTTTLPVEARGLGTVAAKSAMKRMLAREAERDAAKPALRAAQANQMMRYTPLAQARAEGKAGLAAGRQLTGAMEGRIALGKNMGKSPSTSAIRPKAAPQVAVTTKKPAQVVISRGRYPETAAHINEAQRLGQPSVLTIDRMGAATRRKESLRYVPRRSGYPIAGRDRDEYPFAMTREGGFNSSVRYVKSADNRGAGKSIERQVRDLPDGTRVRIHISD